MYEFKRRSFLIKIFIFKFEYDKLLNYIGDFYHQSLFFCHSVFFQCIFLKLSLGDIKIYNNYMFTYLQA